MLNNRRKWKAARRYGATSTNAAPTPSEESRGKTPRVPNLYHISSFRKLNGAWTSPFHTLTHLKLFSCRVRAISNEIQGKYSGEGEFLTRKHELGMQLDECSKKIDALREQKTWILGQVGDRVADSGFERNKPEVSECNKKEEEMKGFDPCLLLNEHRWVF